MRHLKIAAVVAVLGVGLTLIGGGPASGGDENIVNVEKVVVGEAPAGAFLVDVTCTQDTVAPDTAQLAFASDGSTGTQSVGAGGATTCVVAEVDDLGADEVTITCALVSANPTGQASCVDDTTARFDDTLSSEITFTVTNTFVAPEPDPDPEPETDPAAAEPDAADVVRAQPTFTG